MVASRSAWLLTGRPGSGKTTLVKRAVANLKSRAGGFYTEEIRQGGQRLGFKLVTLDGKEATLAHVSFRSPHRVSRYGVDVEALDKLGVAALLEAARQGKLVVVDEIGKMELFSDGFRETVMEIIQGGHRVLGAIMQNKNPFADDLKTMPMVRLLMVTRENHAELLAEIEEWLR